MARERETRRPGWRFWAATAAAVLACVVIGIGARAVHRFLVSDGRFALPASRPGALRLQGVVYASRPGIQRVFAEDFGRSVFAIPIAERRRRLLALDWVEDASVSRAWPNRLVLRIRERTPVAFVNIRPRVLLIDADGVLLDPPVPSRFSFPVLSGVTEEQGEPERRERVQAMLRLLEDLGPLSKDISEVNAASPNNLKVIAQVEGRALELTLGEGPFARRYQNFLSHYPEIRKRSGSGTAFDLRLDDRITAKD